jgi:hypothetical protein
VVQLPYQVDVFLGLKPLEGVVELGLAGSGRRGHDDRRRDGRDAPAELVVGLESNSAFYTFSIFCGGRRRRGSVMYNAAEVSLKPTLRFL